MRIGSVPYLNAKPLIGWFASEECDADIEVIEEVPSRLAVLLEEGRIDVAMVSSFELFRNPARVLVPGISIAADGPVKSVRLFSRVPFPQIRRVALDTSSLTSAALTRILLRELFGLQPEYVPHEPDLHAMLAEADAALLIGNIDLFRTPVETILDLGEAWKELTGMPFVYAAWLARSEEAAHEAAPVLTRARDWGIGRLEVLSVEWAQKMDLPLDRVRDYFENVMQYDLDDTKLAALAHFRERCVRHGLAPAP